MPALSINSTNVRSLLHLWRFRLQVAVASAVAPERAVDLAARIFTTPPRIAHTPRELELLSTGERFEVREGTLSLMAWRFGRADRPLVLFSHGWGGRGAQLRTFVRPLLEAGYQVAFFDHVGHGYSGGVASTLVHFVEGLDAVARHLERDGARIVGVVGHSLGAAAIAGWLNGNGRDARAVLIAPPTSLERYSGYFARRLGIREPVRRAMQERFERALGREWKEFELPHSVAGVRAAALVVHDLDDREVSPRAGVALARAWRGARFLATRGLGHRGVLRDPEVARDVVDFIADRVVFSPPPQPGDGVSFGAPAPIL
jgi:pimeloyl-ACP methyl ester carboxylesterase